MNQTTRSSHRRASRAIHLGSLTIGGEAPVSVQSMTNTDTRDKEATLSQIRSLIAGGCEVIRVAVPDEEAVANLAAFKAEMGGVPLVADIHFNYRLGIMAAEAGVDGVRINPGNVGGPAKAGEIIRACKERGTAVRIGVNAGSLEKDLLPADGHATPAALVESALRAEELMASCRYENYKISLKASRVMTMIESCRLFAERSQTPLHLGVTEAGTTRAGTIKSSVGIGTLLAEGIGETIRVSLTADPVEEVWVAFEILKSLGLRRRGPNVVSCPTCGRTQIDLIGLARRVEEALKDSPLDITVAVMGCVVNGPGEARAADIGVAGGKNSGVIIARGQVVRTVKEDELFEALMNEIRVRFPVENQEQKQD